MRALAIAVCMLGFLTGVAAADAPGIEECPTRDTITLGNQTAATLRTTYELANSDLRVCVDKAVYPYSTSKGHRLLACWIMVSGNANKRVCGTNKSYADWRGYRITVWLRKGRYTESSDVWLQIDQTPTQST